MCEPLLTAPLPALHLMTFVLRPSQTLQAGMGRESTACDLELVHLANSLASGLSIWRPGWLLAIFPGVLLWRLQQQQQQLLLSDLQDLVQGTSPRPCMHDYISYKGLSRHLAER